MVDGEFVPASALAGVDPVKAQRRTLTTLIVAQVVGGLGIGAAIAIGSVAAFQLSGSEQWSGLAGTMITLGAATVAVPLARIAARHGRRVGLSLGWAIAGVGALVTLTAVITSSFPILLAGLLLLGSGTATNLQSRYAATDLSPERKRARHLSIVVWSTTVGSVLGPNLTGPGETLGRGLGLSPLAGPFIFSTAGFAAAVAVTVLFLRPDPLLTAQQARLRDDGPVKPAVARVRNASWSALRHSSAAIIALSAIVVGHGVMVGIMTMTPVHLTHHGAELQIIGLTISLHIAGMYALSPVFGWLADRFGRRAVIVLGQVTLIAAAVVSGTADGSTGWLVVGLILLGLGWSAGLVAGSTLLAESVPTEHRPGVQGLADLLMNLSAAVTGGLSGVILGLIGYSGLSAVSCVLVAVPLLLIVVEWVRRPGQV